MLTPWKNIQANLSVRNAHAIHITLFFITNFLQITLNVSYKIQHLEISLQSHFTAELPKANISVMIHKSNFVVEFIDNNYEKMKHKKKENYNDTKNQSRDFQRRIFRREGKNGVFSCGDLELSARLVFL